MVDADLHSNTRRVSRTHDGRTVGFTEPLDPDNPLRAQARKSEAYRKYLAMRQAEARERASQKAVKAARGRTVQASQARSATRRSKRSA